MNNIERIQSLINILFERIEYYRTVIEEYPERYDDIVYIINQWTKPLDNLSVVMKCDDNKMVIGVINNFRNILLTDINTIIRDYNEVLLLNDLTLLTDILDIYDDMHNDFTSDVFNKHITVAC